MTTQELGRRPISCCFVVVFLVTSLVSTACSSSSKNDTRARSKCEASAGVGRCLLRDSKWLPIGSRNGTTSTSTSSPSSSTTTTSTTTTTPTTTTTAAPTTTSPPIATTPPTARPQDPNLTLSITPLTTQIDQLVNFAGSHQQQTITLHLSFIDRNNSAVFSIQASAKPAYIFVCSAPGGTFGCDGGAEVLIADLGTTPDAALYFEHGSWQLSGRFAVQTVTGPHMGILSIAMRAIPIA